MTTPIPPVTGYASVEDYELRTGIKVPDEMKPTVQTWLNDASALIDVYLGPCKDEVAAAFPDVLTSITVARVQRQTSKPAGVSSASVGGTSVSYDRETSSGWLSPTETDLLDKLLDAACEPDPVGVPGLGELGVGWGGPSDHEPADVVFVRTTGGPRPWWQR